MLHFIRERAQGWLAWVIVGLISIPFALWGVNSYLTGPSDTVVATINGQPIKQAEYQRAFQQYRDQMRNALKEQFDPTLFDSIVIKRSILDNLIDKKLLLLVAADLGQQVSNAELNRIIQSTVAFQTEGQFDQDRYTSMLARVGLNPEAYEMELRGESVTNELTASVQGSTLVAQYATDNLLRLEKQKREISYGVVPALSLVEQIVVEDADVQEYYQQNAANYQAPERISVNYIELSVDALSKTIDVNDSDLQSFYIDNQDQFVGPEQRRASHILIEGDAADALVILDNIQIRLEQGEDFATIATELSQDAGSAQEGGDLGYFQRDVMDPAFEEAVFSMQAEGELSDIIKTEYGHHLIQLTGIKSGEGQSFSDSKSEVEQLYRYQQAEAEFFDKAELLADLSYENPDSLELAAEELSLEIKTSMEFQRAGNISGIATDDKVVAAAFSEDVLINKLNSSVIELSQSHLLVLHENKHVSASQLAYESVAPAITEQLRFERAAEKAVAIGEELLAKMEQGSDGATLFEAVNWSSAQIVDRANSEVSSQVLQRAFSLAKPNGSSSFIGFTATNGNYIILKVSKVEDASMSDIAVEDREGLTSHLNRIYGESELQAFIHGLKAEADIEVFQQYL